MYDNGQIVAERQPALAVERFHLGGACGGIPVKINADFSYRAVAAGVVVKFLSDGVDRGIGIVG